MAIKKTSTPKKTVKAAPAKKATVTKKAAPVKKAAPAKAVAAPKAAPAKKATPAKKVVVAKKATPAKKTVATPKATTVKKAVAPAKKVAVKKAVAAPVVKKTVAKKAEVKPTKKAVAPVVKTETKKAIVNNKPTVATKPEVKPLPKVEAKKTIATKSTVKKEEKPMPIIAHRPLPKPAKKETEIENKDFTPKSRSVLDMPEQPTGPIFRYSDEDLNEFKELILKRIEAARDNLVYYQNLISRKDEAGDDSDNRLNSMEDGSGAMEKEQLSMMAARQVQFINNLEKALVRIENKTYGICRETGKLIDKARLRAVPHATLSIEAKNSMKK